MLALFLKSLLGAAAVLIIALLSKTSNFFVAGLVPLFPTFALIAHYIVGSERTPADLRTTALFGLWSLLPYALYLLIRSSTHKVAVTREESRVFSSRERL